MRMISLTLVNVAMITNVLAVVDDPKGISTDPKNINTPKSNGDEESEQLNRPESELQEEYHSTLEEGFDDITSNADGKLKTTEASTENQETLKPTAELNNVGDKTKEQENTEAGTLPPKQPKESDKFEIVEGPETSELNDTGILPEQSNESTPPLQPGEKPKNSDELVEPPKEETIPVKQFDEPAVPPKQPEETIPTKQSDEPAVPLKQSNESQLITGQANSGDDNTVKSPSTTETSVPPSPTGGDPKKKPTDDKKSSDTTEFKKYLLWGLFGVCVFGFAMTMFMIITK